MKMEIPDQVCPLLSAGMMPQPGTTPGISIPKQSCGTMPWAKDIPAAQRLRHGYPQAVPWDDKGLKKKTQTTQKSPAGTPEGED